MRLTKAGSVALSSSSVIHLMCGGFYSLNSFIGHLDLLCCLVKEVFFSVILYNGNVSVMATNHAAIDDARNAGGI